MPTHRLTPRHPYQASPRGALSYFLPTEVFPEDFIETFEGSALWDLRPDFIVEGPAGAHFGMLASLSEPPQGRCLLTLRLAAVNTFQQVGRILIVLRQRHGDPSPPPLASFELAVHGEHFVAHTFDLVFVPEPTLPLQVGMGFRPGSGLDLVLFRWLTLAPAPPLDVHP
jgi:hypothetical protein